MADLDASAPGKLILVGEHAVVYGRPAIALPLHDVRARAELRPLPTGAGLHFDAPDLGERWALRQEPDTPLSDLARRTLGLLRRPEPDAEVRLRSDIPLASGMGSGAAIATALVHLLARLSGATLDPAQVSALVYESERFYHGTPSGIDNTVVAYARPVWFQRNPEPPHLIDFVPLGGGFTLLIGDTGVRSETRLPVGEVRRRWQEQPARFEALFDQIAGCVYRAREALGAGEPDALGAALDANQALLSLLGVSSPELDRLVRAAKAAGALGAELLGGGWGGVMLALVLPEDVGRVAVALEAAGATRVLKTSLTP